MYCKNKTHKRDPFRPGSIVQCVCEGPIKPKITFFGEQLPKKFLEVLIDKIGNPGECDLLIVIGTALAVQPFASIVDVVDSKTPKVLINMTTTERYDFNNQDKFPGRLYLQGKCDDTVAKIAKDCGWEQDLLKRISKCKSAAKTEETLKKHSKIFIDDLAKAMDQLEIKDEKKEENEDDQQIEESKIVEQIKVSK